MLRPLEPEDLQLLYTIDNDPAGWEVCSQTVPYSQYDLRDYIINQSHDIYADKQLRLVITDDTEQGRAVGLLDLFNFSPEHGRAEMGIAIHVKERGKGYAHKALLALDEYVSKKIHLHQLYCIVPIDNQPSITMLRSAGFLHEIILPDWLQMSHGYKDCVMFVKFY